MIENIILTGGKIAIKPHWKTGPTFSFIHENVWVGEIQIETDHKFKKAYFYAPDKSFEMVVSKWPPDNVQLNSSGSTYAVLNTTLSFNGLSGEVITKFGHRFIIYMKGVVRPKCYVKSETHDKLILSVTKPNLIMRRTIEIFPCDFLNKEELQAIIGIVCYRLICTVIL